MTTTYALPETDLILAHGLQPATIKSYKIHDLPAEGRPREKLLKHGPAALSTKEALGRHPYDRHQKGRRARNGRPPHP